MEDLISRQAAIDEIRKCRFVVDAIEKIRGLPSAQPKTDEEKELKFYYVESIDDYWIGQRLDNFYYADWHDGLGFVWSKSRYLPWGEHVVNEQTLWKEHTYPSEPIEIPFTEWIVGFMKKYSAEPEIIRCKECKYWKDSDGVYRRGFDAESKCPLNLKKVYEGTFYCGMAERRTDG